MTKLNDLHIEKTDYITSDKILYLIISLNDPIIICTKTDFIKNRKNTIIKVSKSSQ